MPGRTPLRMGMKAMLAGKPYYIVGRLSFTRKRFGQDGQWYEWLLLSPDGALLFLQWDGTSWVLWLPIMPVDEPASETLLEACEGDQFPLDGTTATATAAGACAISGYEGAIPWRIAPDEMVAYARLEGGGKIYYGKVPEFGHASWFRGRKLAQAEVFALFGQHYVAKSYFKHKVTSRGLQFMGICWLIAAIIAWVFWHLSPGFGIDVAQGTAPVSVVSAQGAWMGPYNMPAGNRVYQLHLSTDLDTPGGWVAARLDNHAPPNAYNGANQNMAPPEEEEANIQNAESVFRIGKAGWYYVRLSSSLEAPDTPAHISFSLKSGVLYSGYLLFFWIVAGLAGIAMLVVAYIPRA